MGMQRVNLVFGPKTRVVPVRVEGCKVYGDVISRESKLGEQIRGVIGHYRGKLTPRIADQILRGRIDLNQEKRSFRKTKPPVMIDVSNKYAIMKGEVTVGLFRWVMEGYEPTGPDADKVRVILADQTQNNVALTHVNLLEAREFAKRLSEQTGRKFRVPTEGEWEFAKNQLQLKGGNCTWTESQESRKGYVVCRLLYGKDIVHPRVRYHRMAIRLVEDK